jgi:hypothetical protein
MSRCKNCGVEMGPEQTCVFATYKTNIGGQEIIVCCPNCARDLEQAAAQAFKEKVVKPTPATKAAPRKVKRAVRKAKKAPRKRSAVKRAKSSPKRKAAGKKRK